MHNILIGLSIVLLVISVFIFVKKHPLETPKPTKTSIVCTSTVVENVTKLDCEVK